MSTTHGYNIFGSGLTDLTGTIPGTDGITYTISASSTLSTSYPAYNIFNTGLGGAGWKAYSTSLGWIKIVFSSAVTIFRFSIITNNCPVFYFQGSNDGSTWTTLYTGTGKSGSTATVSGDFTTTGAYLQYRFYATSTNTGYYITASDLMFLLTAETRDSKNVDGLLLSEVIKSEGIKKQRVVTGLIPETFRCGKRDKNVPGIVPKTISCGKRDRKATGFLRPSLAMEEREKKLPGILRPNLKFSKRQRITPGYISSQIAKGTREQRTVPGFIPRSITAGKRVRSVTGFMLPNMKPGIRSRSNEGVLVETVLYDSNAADHIRLTVTPTFSYESSAIEASTVNTRESTTGKYSLLIGGTESISYADTSIDLAALSFQLDLADLATGDNSCRLYLLYDDGGRDYLDFVVTLEETYRATSYRTLYTYTGGFSLSGDIGKLREDDMEYVGNNITGGNGVLTTTDVISFDLSKVKGINGINIAGDGCLFLVSFDGRQTWYAYQDSTWVVVDSDNIATNGMTASILSAITNAQWAEIFQRTQLDFMCYMSSLLASHVTSYAPENLYTSGVLPTGDYDWHTKTVSAPSSEYKISKIQTLWSGGAQGSTRYNYAEILSNLYTTATMVIKNYTIGVTSTYVSPDNEKITSITFGFNGTSNSYNYYYIYQKSTQAYLQSITALFQTNSAPTISNVALSPAETHTESTLTAHIADSDGDNASYRILVNGEEFQAYNTGDSFEYDISVVIPSNATIVGTNAITIEATDGVATNQYTTYLTKTDAIPEIVAVLDKTTLTAVISDADADTMSYQITLNDVVLVAWTEFATGPISISYKLPAKSIKVGKENNLVLEVKDSLEQTASVEIDFVGVRYGKFPFII
ncbi:discoidin domain-containing protein [Sporomusa aerivorans]|uniref:discoidin domain-containing protein n=1 Tax=Sporomusa aerivorans TaxID=204936 RepID=UPI00352B9CB1